MQQCPEGKLSTETRCGVFIKFVKYKASMHKDISLGMKLRGLIYSSHFFHFGKYMLKQTIFAKSHKASAWVILSDDVYKLISHPLGAYLYYFRSFYIKSLICRLINFIFEPAGKPHGSHHP